MDGRGRWMDNVFIERLWRSLKYECAYLNAFETDSELRAGLGRWITYYNTQRPHSGLAGQTPAERSEEHTSELQSLMRISYAVFCLKQTHRKKHNSNNI